MNRFGKVSQEEKISVLPELGASRRIRKTTKLDEDIKIQGMNMKGYFDLSTGEMAVPVANTELSLAVRLHEMLHAKHSSLQQVNEMMKQFRFQETGQFIEDIRIHELAFSNPKGFPTKYGERLKTLMIESLPKRSSSMDGKEPAVKLASALNLLRAWRVMTTPEWKKAFKKFDKLERNTIANAIWIGKSKDIILAGRKLEDFFNPIQVPKETKPVEREITQEMKESGGYQLGKPDENDVYKQRNKRKEAELTDDEADLQADELYQSRYDPRESRKKQMEEALRTYGSEAELDKAAEAFAGEMTIKRLSFDGNLKRRFGKVISAAGIAIKRIQNYATDKRIFVRKKPSDEFITILCDASGSMSFGVQDIVDKVLAHASNCTFAYYSGLIESGKLVICAQGLRYATQLTEQYGENIIDYPALKWLAKQRGYKIWISDCIVTGRRGKQSDMLRAACALVVRKARIRIYPNLDTFCESAFMD